MIKFNEKECGPRRWDSSDGTEARTRPGALATAASGQRPTLEHERTKCKSKQNLIVRRNEILAFHLKLYNLIYSQFYNLTISFL